MQIILYANYLLLFCISFVSVYCIDGMLGPADLLFHRFEDCPDKPNGMEMDLYTKKLNGTTWGISANFSVPFSLDENSGLTMIGSKMTDGGFKEGAWYLNETNLCEVIKNLLGEIFEDIRTQNGMDDCPLPAGNYRMKDYIWDNQKFKVPRVYGAYSMKIMPTYNYEPQSCVLAYYDYVPKKE